MTHELKKNTHAHTISPIASFVRSYGYRKKSWKKKKITCERAVVDWISDYKGEKYTIMG